MQPRLVGERNFCCGNETRRLVACETMFYAASRFDGGEKLHKPATTPLALGSFMFFHSTFRPVAVPSVLSHRHFFTINFPSSRKAPTSITSLIGFYQYHNSRPERESHEFCLSSLDFTFLFMIFFHRRLSLLCVSLFAVR